MKILYDHQIFSSQVYGGISRYFCEIISHLPCETEISAKYSDNVYLKNQNLIPDLKSLFDPRKEFIRGKEFKGKGRLFQLSKKINPEKYLDAEEQNRILSIEKLKKQDFDVFHPTYYDDYFLKHIGNKPFVLTVHDMNHELFPEFYSSKEELDFVRSKASLAEKATHIVAVSENTKKDIIEILGINENKITVIHHAVSLAKNPAEPGFDLPARYLLYIGDRGAEYKNFKFMARALAPLLFSDETLFVLCTGTAFEERENTFFRHLGLQGRFLAKFVPDVFLPQIYKRALSLIIPSYSEGFGIPILEAFHNDCPVILADASCFPEIAGDAALFFSPKSMSGLREQVQKILSNELTRNSMIQKGKIREREFDWTVSAQKTAEVYKSVLLK